MLSFKSFLINFTAKLLLLIKEFMMHLRLSPKLESKLSYWRLKYLPRTLFFRTMLLIFVPLIVVQIVSVVVFFDGSWSRMGRKLSENLAADMLMVVELAKQQVLPWSEIQKLSKDILDFEVERYEASSLSTIEHISNQGSRMVIGFFEEALSRSFPNSLQTIMISEDRSDLIVLLDKENYTYKFVAPKKKIFSSSIFMFVVWMVGTSILLFLVAVLFLRIQVRAISDLAQVAEDFGKGIDNKKFKPYGSSEVRKAAIAFIKMKERIQRQISERTQMLAGVSHDLRTPLTRMKLQAAMMSDEQDKKDFLSDIDEMEKMLNGYLAFVRGEAGEEYSDIDINAMLQSIIEKYKPQNVDIKYFSKAQGICVLGREQSLRRAINNVISNAIKYSEKILVKLENQSDKKIIISIEDNGPGIPCDKREEVFKAFYRIEKSRNKETGGIGLGLAITKDIVTSHGGTIELKDSSLGGLLVEISIPL